MVTTSPYFHRQRRCAPIRGNFGPEQVVIFAEIGSNAVRGNEVDGAGANGICLVGTRDLHPTDNRIADNNIHHCGAINKYVAGVFLGLSDGNLVQHNAIHHVPHHGINLGSNGHGRNTLEYNDIHHSCQEIFDTGAINSWADVLDESGTYVPRRAERVGHVIRYNRISDTWGLTQDQHGQLSLGVNTRGIYLDDYTSNCFVYGNIIVRVGGGQAIAVNGGKNNVIENNIMADCRVGPRLIDSPASRPQFWQMIGFSTGNRYRGNIVYTAQDADTAFVFSVRTLTDRRVGYSDKNLFFNTAGRYVINNRDGEIDMEGDTVSLEEWRELGFDVNSVLADPMFVDAEHDDYRLRPESPAFALGFQQIDTGRIGVRDEGS